MRHCPTVQIENAPRLKECNNLVAQLVPGLFEQPQTELGDRTIASRWGIAPATNTSTNCRACREILYTVPSLLYAPGSHIRIRACKLQVHHAQIAERVEEEFNLVIIAKGTALYLIVSRTELKRNSEVCRTMELPKLVERWPMEGILYYKLLLFDLDGIAI